MYIYVYINNILYIVSTPHVSKHPRHLQGALSFQFAKVIKALNPYPANVEKMVNS